MWDGVGPGIISQAPFLPLKLAVRLKGLGAESCLAGEGAGWGSPEIRL